MVNRRAYVVWAVGLAAYVMAVFNRTSFGVAVLPAAERFHASASDLASFSVVQLIVYAGLQIPVGVVLDRIGPRRLILGGALLMSLGQLGMAFTTSVSSALLMRVLIGAGDAVTFISVLRVVTDIFPGSRVPVMTQMTGILGQFGGVLSALPLAAALGSWTWTASFLSLSGLGFLIALLVLVALHVEDTRPAEVAGVRLAWDRIVKSFKHPGTRLGLWSHFTTQFSTTVFALLWGFPFLIQGQGQSRSTASVLLALNVAAGVVVSPILGRLVAKHPMRRSWLVLLIICSCAAGWTLVLLWPGRAPLWVLVVLVVSIAAGGPGSMIGFDFARTFNPAERIGTASGIVNVGGFTASLTLMYAMGVLLDLLTPGHGANYSLSTFKWAFSLQYLFWGFGVAAILISRRRLRAREDLVIRPMRHAMRERWRNRP